MRRDTSALETSTMEAVETITYREITRLKKRRDELLNTACTRFERVAMLAEVRRINERLRVLHVKLGSRSPK